MQENVNLFPFNTFGITVSARYFTTFSNESELQKIVQQLPSQQLLVLGGGSNILLMEDFEGCVLKNEIKGIRVVEETASEVVVEAGAGEIWHNFVLSTIQNGWGGIENLSLIPGSVGASPMQNIGAYGVEIKDVFESLDAMEICTGKIRQFTHEECQFGYRESVFKRALKGKYIITRVRYRLQKHPVVDTHYGAINAELEKRGISQPTIKDVSDAVIAIRRSKLPDPKEIGNSGSFFKNPILRTADFMALKEKHPDMPSYKVDEQHTKVPAGWLIDRAGWKGKTWGNYGVHKNQSLVLVNYGGCTGADIYRLSAEVIADISEKYGIQLEREVNVIGGEV